MSEEAVREILHEVITVSESMAAKIQELSDAATECGNPLDDLQELLKDWGQVYKKTGKDWKSLIIEKGELPAGLASLGLPD